MIYFAQDTLTLSIKIGHTWGEGTALEAIERRISAFQTGCPSKIIPLAYMEGCKTKEHALHERFREYRLEREWFKNTPELIRFIKENAVSLENIEKKRVTRTPGENKKRRETLGVSQADLASHIGVSTSLVSFWERGARNPRPLYRKQWEKVLGRLEKAAELPEAPEGMISLEGIQKLRTIGQPLAEKLVRKFGLKANEDGYYVREELDEAFRRWKSR